MDAPFADVLVLREGNLILILVGSSRICLARQPWTMQTIASMFFEYSCIGDHNCSALWKGVQSGLARFVIHSIITMLIPSIVVTERCHFSNSIHLKVSRLAFPRMAMAQLKDNNKAACCLNKPRISKDKKEMLAPFKVKAA